MRKIPIRRRFLYLYLFLQYRWEYLLYRLKFWRLTGQRNIPHIQKRSIIREIARQYNVHVFIETGTYLGDMILAMSTWFDKLYSVELDEKLYRCAGQRLSHKSNIHLFHGDSGAILCEILACCQQPALFWLDAHYSGEGTASGPLKTPILHELIHILSDTSTRHIILIDDARYFNGIDDYPTLGEIHRIVRQFRPEYNVEIEKDIIRIVPDKQLSLNGMNSVHSPARTYVAS